MLISLNFIWSLPNVILFLFIFFLKFCQYLAATVFSSQLFIMFSGDTNNIFLTRPIGFHHALKNRKYKKKENGKEKKETLFLCIIAVSFCQFLYISVKYIFGKKLSRTRGFYTRRRNLSPKSAMKYSLIIQKNKSAK